MEESTKALIGQSSIIIQNRRLGNCEVCDNAFAVYTCPKCEVKTCCLPCVQIHKKELKCDGIRNRTKYIPLSKITEKEFVNDYRFLEECTRYVDSRKSDKIKRFTSYKKYLQPQLFHLRKIAELRGITLKFLLHNFSRRSTNTTFYDKQLKVIFWRVEWVFVNAGNLKICDERCSENEKIICLLNKFFEMKNFGNNSTSKKLEFYQSKGNRYLKIFLKAEEVKRSKNRFYLLDGGKTLRENLAGKTIIEFPIIHVTYDNVLDGYDVIDSDEDVQEEVKQFQESLNMLQREILYKTHESKKEQCDTEEKTVLGSKLNKKDREKKHDLENGLTNLLFPDERILELLSDSEDVVD